MITQHQRQRKIKIQDVMKFSLDEFNQIDAPHGHSAVSLKMTGLDRADTMADYDQQWSETQQITAAPRVHCGPGVDYDLLSDEGLFRKSAYNLPNPVEENRIQHKLFNDNEVKRIGFSRTNTTVKLGSKDALYQDFSKHSLLTRTIVFLLIVQVALKHLGCHCARTRLRNTLDVKFNLDCHLEQCNSTDPDKPAVNLFQVVSSNPESPDKTNFIWSNIGGPPMVITTSSSQESSLNIDWDVLLNGKQTGQNETSGFHFNVTQDASIGLLVEKIILFDDTNKNGLFTPDKPRIEIEWSDIVWDLASRTTYHKDDFLKTHLRMKPKHQYLNGNILIKLAIPRDYKADRQKEVPHLKLNNQSISMVITVEGIQPPVEFKNTRLAMTFVVVVQSPAGQVSLDTDSESLISDEYTPGVFRIKSLQFKTKQDIATSTQAPEEINSPIFAQIEGDVQPSVSKPTTPPGDKLGFLYWKEVAYTDRRKIISRTIDVFDSEMQMPFDSLPNISQPFYQFFKYKPNSGPKPDYKLYRFELIYGKDSASYSSTNYTDFSFVFGLGAAPQEQMFSFLVKIVIFVCFCLPVLVMLAGLGYLMLRRFRRIGDTELLLAAET